MIDINFIEEGTDERILKSFIDNNNVDQEELEKAIRDRSKLVPKAITDQNELADNLEKQGFKLDAADRRAPYKRVTMTRGNQEYTATFNKYSDGGVEVINIRPSY